MKIFKTKIAVISEDQAAESIKLQELGIDSSIEDENIKWKNCFIPIHKITFVEECLVENEFNITFDNGTVITVKDNPFQDA